MAAFFAVIRALPPGTGARAFLTEVEDPFDIPVDKQPVDRHVAARVVSHFIVA